MNRIHALALALCPLLAACDGAGEQDRGAGGFGSETTNGIQVAASGEAGTILTARSLDRVEAPYQMRIDSTGALQWKLPPGSWAVEASLGERGILRHLALRSTDTAAKLEWLSLAEPGSLQGRVAGVPLSQDLNVWLPGLGRCVPVHADGSFRVDDVPSGPHVVRLVQGNTVLAESFGNTCDCSAIVLDPTERSFLLDDFDGANGVPHLSLLVPNSQWLVWGALVDSKLFPPDSMWLLPEPEAGAWSGRSLHAPPIKEFYGLNTTLALMFGSRGVPESESFYDLSGSDSLVFRTKGTGHLDVGFWARTEGQGRSEGAILPSYHVGDLDSAWKRVAIAWKDFLWEGGVPVGDGFRQMKLHKITFTYSSGDLWLDDIRIVGAKPSMFLR